MDHHTPVIYTFGRKEKAATQFISKGPQYLLFQVS